MTRLFAASLVLPLAMALSGCIVVVDNEPGGSRSSWSDSDSSPRYRLGVTTERPDAVTASQLGVNRDRTSVITYVVPGSPAERAGLRRFDIITGIDANDTITPGAVREIVRSHRKGDELKITYIREGKPCETTATLE
jgi:S1-C subfamily serine protease